MTLPERKDGPGLVRCLDGEAGYSGPGPVDQTTMTDLLLVYQQSEARRGRTPTGWQGRGWARGAHSRQ